MSTTNSNDISLNWLLEKAMDPAHLQHASNQAPLYVKGEFAGGDKFEATKGDNTTGAFKGQVQLTSLFWAHYKKIDEELKKAAATSQIGIVLGIPMYNESIPSFHQNVYDGKKMKNLHITLTEHTQTGGVVKFGEIILEEVHVSTVIYQYFSLAGPTAFVGLLSESHTSTVGKRSVKSKNGVIATGK